MTVTAHLATGQHLSIEPVHRLSDDFQVRGPVCIVAVDRLTPVATRGDVVDGAGKLDAQGAGHAGIGGVGGKRQDLSAPAKPARSKGCKSLTTKT